MPLKLMYITNQPEIALLAEQNGVDWVFIDLELNGKVERQGHLDTVISRHAIRDVSRLRAVLKHAELLVRVNPIFQGSRYEINEVINRGADVVMLPYYKSVDEVAAFIELVDKRAGVCLLCETKEAVACMPDVLQLSGIDYVHIGLNDLHLSYGQSFLFEPLADGTVEAVTRQLQIVGIPYGFGGIARIGEGRLPAEKVLGEHVRLGSSLAILSRSFCNIGVTGKFDARQAQMFQEGVWKIRVYEQQLEHATPEWLELNRLSLVSTVDAIATEIQNRKGILS
ncbi:MULTISPECIES: aldolase/citrate lyase family protein [unclassified Exiguobacterium]|uniref:aldolase/citrate lyase family protein n=1 Tax=unclassified Exiguobacterium TaxID=2644629 RepID=UPI00103F9841|nr:MULTISPECIES: aldolase/citrate lyase family protein [unclassified Exiguobacterium]TCI66791.1 aldolase [Exiguobacterium sp. IPCI3]TCI76247.1 aldolase [Exiguobacterium sp. IPCH1]TCI77458.1 aldolase [Exiguobacterium sp. IPBC4]